MALIEGVNCGFVLVAPTADPLAVHTTASEQSTAGKFTSPSGAIKITEIGWWCDDATQEANFEVGLYSHNSGDNEPEERLYVNDTNAKGTTAGWKVVSGLDWEIIGGTIYWLAFQLDETVSPTSTDMNPTTGRLAYLYLGTGGEFSLINPWGTSSVLYNWMQGIYAVYETEAPVGTNMQINISGVLKDVLEVKPNISGVLKDVLEVKQNIGGVLKDVFG